MMTVSSVFADDEGGRGEYGEGLGSVAVGLLGVGAVYVVIRRSVYLYGTWDGADPEIKKRVRRVYAKVRTPLLHIHQISLVVATIAGIAHGLLIGSEGAITFYSGWIAAIVMALSSISGFILWRRMKPIMKSSKLFLPIRIFHRQWLMTFILGVFLIIHVA